MNKIHLTEQNIRAYVLDIIRQMQRGHYQPDLIIGLSRGGLIPATMISHWTGVPMRAVNFSTRDDTTAVDSIRPYLATYKNILIVDDINDTGVTLHAIDNDISLYSIENDVSMDMVRYAVLIDNTSSTFNDIHYSGGEINKREHDAWVVFPWEEWWKL